MVDGRYELLRSRPLQATPSTSSPPPSYKTYFISLVHSSKSPLQLKQVHSAILRCHLPLSSHLAAQSITAAAATLRAVPYALSLFRRFSPPSPPLFDALTRALSDASCFAAALSHFALSPCAGLRATRLSLPFALRSAASLPAARSGPCLNAAAACLALDLDPFVRTSLADMYVKLESPELVLRLFDDTPEWHKAANVQQWNVLINGCCLSGDLESAQRLFDSMPMRSVASWNSLIRGCMGEGEVERAAELFDQMTERTVVF